uniref:Desumoylating isopeptidase 1 n=1 Tax=Hirondellea gigas TaxID=1518452 RepID=A0A6A7G6U8_9CRUS
MASEDEEEKVLLHVYDLTHGMAAQYSEAFLGRKIEGLWHTGIVVFGKEYFYGGGIQCCNPGCSMAGQPSQVIPMGKTSIPVSIFREFCQEISPRYTPETYSLLSHNCNNFTSEACQFLTGEDIPSWITGLPAEVLSTPLGAMIRPIIEGFERSMKQSLGSGASDWAPIVGGDESSSIADSSSSSASSSSAPPADASRSEPGPIIDSDPQSLSASIQSSDSFRTIAQQQTEEKQKQSHHPHTKMKLYSISEKPLLNGDDKASDYVKLILGRKVKRDIGFSKTDVVTMKSIVQLLKQPESEQASKKVIDLLERILSSWPANQLGSVVALLRLLLIRPDINHHFSSVDGGLPIIYSVISTAGLDEDRETDEVIPPSLQMLVLCALSNLFAPCSRNVSDLARDEFIFNAALIGLTAQDNVAVRSRASSLLFNCAIFMPKRNEDEVIQVATTLSDHINHEKAKAPRYRQLMTLLHLMYRNSEVVELLIALDFKISTNSNEVAMSPKINLVIVDVNKILESLDDL